MWGMVLLLMVCVCLCEGGYLFDLKISMFISAFLMLTVCLSGVATLTSLTRVAQRSFDGLAGIEADMFGGQGRKKLK